MKLGGKSNPRGMLSRQDYSFQEPEEFPGTVTLRVEHGSHRFSTEEQLLFRDRWQGGETMRARREKHVFQSYTRMIVMLITAGMTIFGLFLGGFAIYLVRFCHFFDHFVTFSITFSIIWSLFPSSFSSLRRWACAKRRLISRGHTSPSRRSSP